MMKIVCTSQDDAIINMLKKSQQGAETHGDCIKGQAKERKTTCFMRKITTEYYIDEYNKE